MLNISNSGTCSLGDDLSFPAKFNFYLYDSMSLITTRRYLSLCFGSFLMLNVFLMFLKYLQVYVSLDFSVILGHWFCVKDIGQYNETLFAVLLVH